MKRLQFNSEVMNNLRPYMVPATAHTNHLYKLRHEQTPEVTTRMIVVPRSGKFKNGETLTWTDSYRQIHSVVFNRTDTEKDKSWVKRGSENLLVYTYQLTR